MLSKTVNESRPRRPSPPPKGARAREPPSPSLIARSLPSTATLNALPMLSRASSKLNIASESIPSETEGEWIVIPVMNSVHPIDAIKRVLGLDDNPEVKDVVLDYPFLANYIYALEETKAGKIWTLRLRSGSRIESARFEMDRAYRIHNPGDVEKLLEYYSDVYELKCEIKKCVFVWETVGETARAEGSEERSGRIIVASWPLKSR